MTASVAARLALRHAIHQAIADIVENEGPDYAREEYAAARRRLETSVRRERNAPVRETEPLKDAVVHAAPKSHQNGVLSALIDFEDALSEEEIVQRDISYFIGVAVGQALRGDETWDFVSMDDVDLPSRRRRRNKHR